MTEGTIMARYAYTEQLSRSRWAWEFLRRNPEFQEDARRAAPGSLLRRPGCRTVELLRAGDGQAAAGRWGLLAFPDPDCDGASAELFWNPALYGGALRVQIAPRSPEESCEIFEESTRRARILHLTDLAGREHLLIRAGHRSVQAACEGLSLLSTEPVRIQIILGGGSNLDTHLRCLDRARRLLSDPEPRCWTRSSRALCIALMALDCHQAGLSQRETARLIYGAARTEEGWGPGSDALRAEIRRARRKGQHYASGGYAELLGAPSALDVAA